MKIRERIIKNGFSKIFKKDKKWNIHYNKLVNDKCTKFQVNFLKNGWVLPFWMSKMTAFQSTQMILPFLWFPTFFLFGLFQKCFQIFFFISKTITISTTITNYHIVISKTTYKIIFEHWPKNMYLLQCSNPKFTFLTFSGLMTSNDLTWHEVTKGLGEYLEESQTWPTSFHQLCSKLIWPICPETPVMTNTKSVLWPVLWHHQCPSNKISQGIQKVHAWWHHMGFLYHESAQCFGR